MLQQCGVIGCDAHRLRHCLIKQRCSHRRRRGQRHYAGLRDRIRYLIVDRCGICHQPALGVKHWGKSVATLIAALPISPKWVTPFDASSLAVLITLAPFSVSPAITIAIPMPAAVELMVLMLRR